VIPRLATNVKTVEKIVLNKEKDYPHLFAVASNIEKVYRKYNVAADWFERASPKSDAAKKARKLALCRSI
jgi:hypothetical protein